MPKKNVYIIVTNDKYEIPIKMDCIGVKEAASYIGISENYARKMMCGYNPWTTRYKIIQFGEYKPNRKKYMKQFDLTHDRTEYFKKYYKEHKAERMEYQRKMRFRKKLQTQSDL